MPALTIACEALRGRTLHLPADGERGDRAGPVSRGRHSVRSVHVGGAQVVRRVQSAEGWSEERGGLRLKRTAGARGPGRRRARAPGGHPRRTAQSLVTVCGAESSLTQRTVPPGFTAGALCGANAKPVMCTSAESAPPFEIVTVPVIEVWIAQW